MADSQDVLPLCRFAESLVIPRINRIDADLVQTRGDMDTWSLAVRKLDAALQSVSIAQQSDERRIERLERLMTDQAAEISQMHTDLSSIKTRVEAMWDRTGSIATGIEYLKSSAEKQTTLSTRQHHKRMRVLILIATLLGGLFGFAALAHETISGKPISESVKVLLGIVK